MTVASVPVAWTDWTLDPVLLWGAAAAVVHEVGRRRVRLELSPGRVVTTGQVLCFWAGLAVALLAVLSPLEQAAHQLFALHMVQHLLLSLVAPLLLAAASPLRVMSRALRAPARRAVLRAGGRAHGATTLHRTATRTALVAVALHVVVLGLWHVPAAYELAERVDLVHAVEHLSLFGTGLLFWWVVLRARWENRSGLAIVYLFLTGLPMGALAALLTLAPSPAYDSHLATTAAWGLSPLEDQQLAGAIMWVPGGIVYLSAAVVLFVRWLEQGPAAGERRLAWDA